MGLLDRIQAAKRGRGDGEVPGGTAGDLTGTSATEASVDLRPRPRQQWGRPGRCPDCNGQGYLDHIDLVDRIMFQHCKECGHKWQVAQAEILAEG